MVTGNLHTAIVIKYLQSFDTLHVIPWKVTFNIICLPPPHIPSPDSYHPSGLWPRPPAYDPDITLTDCKTTASHVWDQTQAYHL